MRDKKSMSTQNRPDDGAPAARLEFARRLRELRIPRGFRTARSLARSLDIDENRYTRYERAEVEPDLAMIRRICETLDVTPNDLLGGVAMTRDFSQSASRPNSHSGTDGIVASTPGRNDQPPIPTAAWLLAEAAIEAKGAPRAPSGATLDLPLPLASMGEIGKLYKALMEQPFEAIADLLSDQAIAGADPAAARSLKERIDVLVALVKSTA